MNFMHTLSSSAFTVAANAVALGLVIFLHESGHFIACRKLGFGPPPHVLRQELGARHAAPALCERVLRGRNVTRGQVCTTQRQISLPLEEHAELGCRVNGGFGGAIWYWT